MAALPGTMLYVEDYAEDAMDIRNTLVTKMQQLSPEEFEDLLRPGFEQDGFAVGDLQLLMVEYLTR